MSRRQYLVCVVVSLFILEVAFQSSGSCIRTDITGVSYLCLMLIRFSEAFQVPFRL